MKHDLTPLCDVPAKYAYEWVKTGKWNLARFNEWVLVMVKKT